MDITMGETLVSERSQIIPEGNSFCGVSFVNTQLQCTATRQLLKRDLTARCRLKVRYLHLSWRREILSALTETCTDIFT